MVGQPVCQGPFGSVAHHSLYEIKVRRWLIGGVSISHTTVEVIRLEGAAPMYCRECGVVDSVDSWIPHSLTRGGIYLHIKL